MPGKFLKSPNAKLYLMIIGMVVVFIFFFVAYTKDYYNYYKELYNYRKDLISYLTEDNSIKPIYTVTDPTQGNLTADIKIFEFADFSCENCRLAQAPIKQLMNYYGQDKVLLIWKDLPTSSDNYTLEAHQAARCAMDQDKFFEYGAKLFENQGSFSPSLFGKIAQDLKLDMTQFNQCYTTQKYKTTVENKLRESLQIGLDSAPAVFINDRQLTGQITFDNMKALVEGR